MLTFQSADATSADTHAVAKMYVGKYFTEAGEFDEVSFFWYSSFAINVIMAYMCDAGRVCERRSDAFEKIRTEKIR
jgi:hypothetical protein